MTAADMRAAMVDSQLRTSDVIDSAVVAAMGSVPREAHVPPAFASVAYMDRAIPLAPGRALNPPLVTGRMLVAADVAPDQRVLLIGGATGYMAALLAAMGAKVHAVEENPDLMAQARAAVKSAAVHWVEGPLSTGAPGTPPFHRIIIDGAVEQLPGVLTAQLASGGRLVAAMRDGAVTRLVHGVKTGGTVALRSFADMDAAPLPGFAAPKSFRF